jgi:hypothetical protein
VYSGSAISTQQAEAIKINCVAAAVLLLYTARRTHATTSTQNLSDSHDMIWHFSLTDFLSEFQTFGSALSELRISHNEKRAADVRTVAIVLHLTSN